MIQVVVTDNFVASATRAVRYTCALLDIEMAILWHGIIRLIRDELKSIVSDDDKTKTIFLEGPIIVLG